MTRQELSDREEIRDVLVRYACGLDRREFDQVASCFTPDALASFSGVALEPGVDNIVRHVRGVANLVATTHFVGATSFDVRGDEAETENYAIAYLVDRDKVRVRGLRYHDKWVRTPDGWRIRHRVHAADWMFEAPALPTRIS
jgi:hypothetical protein